MQAVQVVLFIVVVALALPLIAYVVIPRLRAGRRPVQQQPAPIEPVQQEAAPRASPPPPPSGLVCPSCRREYPSGLKYCPVDARALVAAVGTSPPSRAATSSLTCPVCKRSYEGNKRFCPYDAEELVPMPVALARKARMAASGFPHHILGKICPHCAKRYDSEATFCGHDGSELVSVN
jgi:hypothetical protein